MTNAVAPPNTKSAQENVYKYAGMVTTLDSMDVMMAILKMAMDARPLVLLKSVTDVTMVAVQRHQLVSMRVFLLRWSYNQSREIRNLIMGSSSLVSVHH